LEKIFLASQKFHWAHGEVQADSHKRTKSIKVCTHLVGSQAIFAVSALFRQGAECLAEDLLENINLQKLELYFNGTSCAAL